MSLQPKQKTTTIYIADPDHLFPLRKKGQYGARIAVPFSTKDPLQMAAYRALQSLKSEGVRDHLGIATYKQLVEQSDAAGLKPAAYIRARLMQLRFQATSSLKRDVIATVRRQLGSDLPRVTPFSSVGPNIEDSPEPVRRLLDRYAPGARCILDPFAGTANVAIVAAERGLEGYWCEIDPVIREVAQLKIDLLVRTNDARRAIARRLREHKNRMWTRILAEEPAGDLGVLRSESDVIDTARRCRTYIDQVATKEPLTARALEAAVAEALARVSENESPKVTQTEGGGLLAKFRAAIGQEIESLIVFVQRSPALSRIPHFLAADASTLADLVPVGADVVITAPPSLTLEATTSSKPARWFMRMKADDQEVPARNYDVSAIRKLLSGPRRQKRKVLDQEQTGFDIIETIRGLREVILQLDGQGHHDLALAVSRYFVEMGRVIAAVSHHICDDAVFILDVSDSWLGPVHVDTDILFGSLLRHFGFVAEDDLPIAAAGEAGERTRRVVVFRRPKKLSSMHPPKAGRPSGRQPTTNGGSTRP